MFCFHQTGIQAAVDSIKSFILPLCVIEKHISIEEALYLSRLELEFQVISYEL